MTPLILISASNEMALDGEWLKITPWGEFPNPVGRQKVTREDGERMVESANSFINKLRNGFLGLPIYAGHPEEFPKQYGDSRRYGSIKKLEAREDGLYGLIRFNDLGLHATNEGYYQFCSPVWRCRPDGSHIRPYELKSVGLTNWPNIPGDAWAKNDSETPEERMLRTKLIGILAINGSATDAEIEAAIGGLKGEAAKVATLEQACTTAANELATTKARVTELEGQLTAANTKATTAETNLTAANAKVTTLEQARVKRELDLAVASGRIVEADRVAWNTKLTADFDGGVAELAKTKVAINTKSQLGGVSGRKNEGSGGTTKAAQISVAVNETMQREGCGYHDAYMKVKAAKPELFN